LPNTYDTNNKNKQYAGTMTRGAKGLTPLMHAVDLSNLEMIKSLVHGGADPTYHRGERYKSFFFEGSQPPNAFEMSKSIVSSNWTNRNFLLDDNSRKNSLAAKNCKNYLEWACKYQESKKGFAQTINLTSAKKTPHEQVLALLVKYEKKANPTNRKRWKLADPDWKDAVKLVEKLSEEKQKNASREDLRKILSEDQALKVCAPFTSLLVYAICEVLKDPIKKPETNQVDLIEEKAITTLPKLTN